MNDEERAILTKAVYKVIHAMIMVGTSNERIIEVFAERGIHLSTEAIEHVRMMPGVKKRASKEDT